MFYLLFDDQMNFKWLQWIEKKIRSTCYGAYALRAINATAFLD